jgi:hypothetical protein
LIARSVLSDTRRAGQDERTVARYVRYRTKQRFLIRRAIFLKPCCHIKIAF